MSRLVIINETVGIDDLPLQLGEAEDLYAFGGDWSKAIGRLFLEKKVGFEVSIKHEDDSVERFYLKEVD